MNLLMVISFPLVGIMLALAIAWWETRPTQASPGPFDWESHAPDDLGAEIIQLPR